MMMAVRLRTGLMFCLAIVALMFSIGTWGEQAAWADPPPPKATADTLTDAQVVQAIQRAIDFLVADVDKKLEPIKKVPVAERADPKHLGEPGELMLQTYALLHVGADMRDPRLQIHQERMQYLLTILIHGDYERTYTTALQTLALSQLPRTSDVQRAITRTSTKLMKGQGSLGGYSYMLDGSQKDRADQSNSQYAVLGVWAASDFGVSIPLTYWKGVNDFWRSIQTPSGGWNYEGALRYPIDASKQPATPSMTAAGVATLYVCDEFLNRSASLNPRADPAIDRGFTAMLKDYDPNSRDLYYLYGVERAALASGSKFFGPNNWYRQIAANLINRQLGNGSFDCAFSDSNDVRAACYGILLLSRGRSPVVMNKLLYNGAWNARKRDSANLHAELSKRFERHLNWQVIPMSAATEEWLDAPILLITGSKDPEFNPHEVAKLRSFVESGGLIFSVSDGESKEFSDAMAVYAPQMVGQAGVTQGALRKLTVSHPIFNVFGSNPNPPEVYGVSNGVREVWVHSPKDLGAVWQANNLKEKDAWDLPASLLFYMAGKDGLRSKLQPLSLPEPAKAPKRHINVARLTYPGNWNPEPGAWPRFVKLMALQANSQVTVQEMNILALPETRPMPALAHLGGVGKLVLSPEEQKALQDYVKAGGTLFVEAIGGNGTFAGSAREALKATFPEGKLKVVPPDYTLITGAFWPECANIGEVEFRRFWILEHGRQTAPRLEYMTLNRRASVLFSPEDITCGLLGTNTWSIAGYAPDSAVALARNIVLYAARNAPKKPVAPRASSQ